MLVKEKNIFFIYFILSQIRICHTRFYQVIVVFF